MSPDYKETRPNVQAVLRSHSRKTCTLSDRMESCGGKREEECTHTHTHLVPFPVCLLIVRLNVLHPQRTVCPESPGHISAHLLRNEDNSHGKVNHLAHFQQRR